jgi:hypothetical protein
MSSQILTEEIENAVRELNTLALSRDNPSIYDPFSNYNDSYFRIFNDGEVREEHRGHARGCETTYDGPLRNCLKLGFKFKYNMKGTDGIDYTYVVTTREHAVEIFKEMKRIVDLYNSTIS